jgi:hypothetical protein
LFEKADDPIGDHLVHGGSPVLAGTDCGVEGRVGNVPRVAGAGAGTGPGGSGAGGLWGMEG